ncbi:uncharacterized protein DNG_00993 [Cephalotrichum gorgonifer]|uniref:Btz domain-containing protein n=1 Tax=Cephalotrichum gorgonifer TaxID=2041049 RepID=A0AAE8SRG0_9PEZI|nr:uncharacterized protein DNG_00993 [Cephalotrichum gorgonifer]
MAASRRRRIGRRRVDDEGDEEGGPDTLDLDDDSLTDGSGLTDDDDPADDSDTSNIEDDSSPTVANSRKAPGNGAAKPPGRPDPTHQAAPTKQVAHAEMMLHDLTITDQPDETVQEMHINDVVAPSPPKLSPDAPLIVSSTSASRPAQGAPADRRRREHEEYKRRRDEDPAFVPNRGAFFMHDHRHAGPAANGFRPFSRPVRGGGNGGRGRGGFGSSFSPYPHVPHQQQQHQHQHQQNPADPIVSGPWAHDMHEVVAQQTRPTRPPRRVHDEGPPNGNSNIPVCPPNPTPINRTLSTEKHIANAQVRVFFPPMEAPVVLPGLQVKQYTKLPDHRPPLRRDKPVRISLPDNPPRYIFPAVDRSFIFIPRAMRPNQKPAMRGGRGPRSVLGSVGGGWSRRTSVFGGSYYGGSVYSPSVAPSRRSSFAQDGRDYVFSPTGSVVSRPPMPPDPNRPVVRLPPTVRPDQPAPTADAQAQPQPADRPFGSSITNLPPPRTHPLPQKPTFQENRPQPVPMYQPRPQKTVSVADIESPTMNNYPQAQPQAPQAYQQAFHQQVPVQMGNGGPPDAHARHPSFQSQHSAGTPLSQIPERAIHAAPFQPNSYPQQPFYNQPYPAIQPQQGYYYPQPYAGDNMQSQPGTAPPYMPAGAQAQPTGYPPQSPPDSQGGQGNGQRQNLVAQEVNGMVYYYDPSQLPAMNTFPGYPAPQGYAPGPVPMGGVVTPSPEGFYPYQPGPGMMYYQQ